MTSEARHRQPARRRSHQRRRSEEGRRGASPFPTLPAILFRALGFVLFFAACVVMFLALTAAASLDVWAGALGGLSSVVTAVVGYGLVVRGLP